MDQKAHFMHFAYTTTLIVGFCEHAPICIPGAVQAQSWDIAERAYWSGS